jgi:hypothetical protein
MDIETLLCAVQHWLLLWDAEGTNYKDKNNKIMLGLKYPRFYLTIMTTRSAHLGVSQRLWDEPTIFYSSFLLNIHK